jgi:hypothetical protein
MNHALQLPNATRSVAIALVAALLGAGIATTTYALTDDHNSPSRVVVEAPSGGDSKAEPTKMSGARP